MGQLRADKVGQFTADSPWLHQIKEFSVNLQVKFPHMKNSTSYESIKDYQTPSLRVIEADLELSFLQSNLEPIGGGDDPDIDW